MRFELLKRRGLPCALAALALTTGAAGQAATSAESCNDDGRAFCITVTDTDRVSPSTTQTRHMSYSIRIRNGGRAALTNVSARVELMADVVNDVEQATDAAFLAAFVPARCRLESSTAIECDVEDLSSNEVVVLGTIVARTSRTGGATATRINVTARGDEAQSDRPKPDPQPDTFTVPELTTYELDADRSATVVFDGGSATLATDPGDQQQTTFAVPVPLGFVGSVYASLEEFSPDEAGYFCPAGLTCWGQSMSISATGIFSALNLAEVVTTASLRIVPGGVKASNVRAFHRYDDGTLAPPITRRCSTPFGVLPPAGEVPCLNAVTDPRAGTMTIRVVDAAQGQWGFE